MSENQQKSSYNLQNLKALEHSLESFTLQEIQVKAKGGRMAISYSLSIEETLEQDGEPMEWQEPCAKEMPLATNSKIFDLLQDLRLFVPSVANAGIEDIEITKVKFRKMELEGGKQYDLNIYYRSLVFSVNNGSPQNTGWVTLGSLSDVTKTDYEDLDKLLVDIELNAYQYCVCGVRFPPKGKNVEIANNGQMDF